MTNRKHVMLIFFLMFFLANCSSIRFNTCKDAGLKTNGKSYTYTCDNLVEMAF